MPVSEEVVHFYNVITGTVCCGLDLEKAPNRTVFPERATCPSCRQKLDDGKDE